MTAPTTYFRCTPEGRAVSLPFCPGCSHAGLLRALDQALVRLQLDPRRVVLVTDIGCTGLSDQYFTTHAFHGLHGRSVTYGVGLRLADPSLHVIVMMGDGACGIGGHHLINAARRNVGITVLVFNNFNFGMTGGQHSVTTPLEGITTTTAEGNIEAPLDICALVQAGRPGFVARGTAFDDDLPELMARAIAHPGFAFLDLWEFCSAYYVPRNDLNRKKLFAMMEDLGLARGILTDVDREEFSLAYRRKHHPPEPRPDPTPPDLTPAFRATLDPPWSVTIAGSAGEKIQSAAGLLATAGILCDLDASLKSDFPITVMTGHSVSEILLSPDRIHFTGIDSPDDLLILSEEGLQRVLPSLQRAGPETTVWIEEDLPEPTTRATVRRIPFRRIGKPVGKKGLPMAALGTILACSHRIPLDALREAVRRTQKESIARANLEAVDLGAAFELPA